MFKLNVSGRTLCGARRRMRPVMSALVVAFAGTATVSADDAGSEKVELKPEAGMQRSLDELAAAADESNFKARLDEWLEQASREPAAHLLQLVWYAAEHKGGETTHAFIGTLLKRLDYPKSAAVAAIAPHLDDESAGVREVVARLLVGYEDRSATRPPDFSAYRDAIEADVRAGREPRHSLVRLMYTSDAGTALLTMVRACQLRDPEEIKPILWAEHVVSDLLWRRRYGFIERHAVEAEAQRQIRVLSRHPHWWVRMYVAQLIGVHPELGDDGLVKTLLSDTHELVRRTMMSFQVIHQPAQSSKG